MEAVPISRSRSSDVSFIRILLWRDKVSADSHVVNCQSFCPVSVDDPETGAIRIVDGLCTGYKRISQRRITDILTGEKRAKAKGAMSLDTAPKAPNR